MNITNETSSHDLVSDNEYYEIDDLGARARGVSKYQYKALHLNICFNGSVLTDYL